MYNAYSAMKSKAKKELDDNVNLAVLTNILVSMFEYKNLPDTLEDWQIETQLISTGSCGVCEMNGGLYTGVGAYCGNVVNFVPDSYLITNVGVGEKQGKVGVDFAVGWNNSLAMPDLRLMQIASVLTEIDVSERCNVIFSRFLRIPLVRDSKEKVAIENAVNSIIKGKFETVMSDNVLEKMIKTGSDENKFLDLVDVKEVDKLQYLNQYRDNVMKRFFMEYGQGMQTTSKLAQQTTDEIHGTDAISMILVLDRLKRRKKFVEDINKLFGTNVTVDFSECWKDQREEMNTLTKTGEKQKVSVTDESKNNDVSDM